MKKSELKQLIREEISKVVNENKPIKKIIDYLTKEFEIYLEGGDDFPEEPGKKHTFVMDAATYGDYDEYDNADMFEKAHQHLQSSPLTINVDEGTYQVTFKTRGKDIAGTFIVPDFDY